MAKHNTNPRHSLRKRFLRLGLLLALFTIVLYVGNRMLSERNMVRSYEAPATTAETPTAFSDRLRIATFNIAHGRGTNTSNFSREADRQPRLDAIAKLLKDEKIDLAVLQEVDVNTVWSGHHNQAAHIASAAGFEEMIRLGRECREKDLGGPL